MTPPVIKPLTSRPVMRHRRPVREPNRYVIPIIIVGLLALILQMYWMQEHWGDVVKRDDHMPFDTALIDKLKARIINLYECEYCLGSGLLDDPDQPGERLLCEICHGVGYNATRRYTDDDRMCLACGGMGRRYDDDGETGLCTRCDGRGIVEIHD